MTAQFNSDTNEIIESLRRSRISPSQSTAAAKYQPPAMTDELGRSTNASDLYSEIFGKENVGGRQRLRDTLASAFGEERLQAREDFVRNLTSDSLVDSVKEFAGGAAEAAYGAVTDPVGFGKTVTSVVVRKTVPMLAGAFGGMFADMQELRNQYNASLDIPLLDIYAAKAGITETDPLKRRRAVLSAMAVDQEIPSLSRWWADLSLQSELFADSLRSTGQQLMEDSYLSFSPDQDRWITVSEKTYRRDILRDPFGEDPATNAGVFVGNTLASLAPTVAMVVAPETAPAMMATYFAMGYADGANGVRDYRKERGEEASLAESIINGIGGGTIEMALERFEVKQIKTALKGVRKAANARMGRVIHDVATNTAKPGAIRRAADSIADVLPDKVKAVARIQISNTLEEFGTEVANNLREMLLYDREYSAGPFGIGIAARVLEGGGQAALGGFIGGAPFSGAAMFSGRGGPEARQGERLAAREAAMKLRQSLPETLPPVTGPRDTAPTLSGPEAPPVAAPAAPAGGTPATPDIVPAVFAAEGKAAFNQAVQDARTTGEIPSRSELASTQERFESEAYAADIVENHPEFALALVNAGRGGLSRRLMSLVFRGTNGKGRPTTLTAESRAKFVDNLRRAINASKKGRSIQQQTEQSLRQELNEIGKEVKAGTVTEEGRARAKAIQAELTRRKNKEEQDASVAREGLEIDNEVEAEVSPEPDTADAVAAATERRAPKKPVAEAPKAEPERKAPPTARPDAEEMTPQQVIRDVEKRIKELRERKDALRNEKGDIPKSKMRAANDLDNAIRAENERAEEARDDIRIVELEKKIAELEEEVDLYDPDDPSVAGTLDSRRQELADLQDELDAIIDKYEWESEDAVGELAEEEVEEPEAEAPEAEKPKKKATEKEADAKAEAETEKPATDRTVMGVPPVNPKEVVGPFQKLIDRMGIIGEATNGQRLDELTHKQLLALAKRERVIPATPDMSENQLIESILDLRMYRLGIPIGVLARAKPEAMERLFGSRRRGEKGKTLADVIERRRASKEVPQTPAEVEQEITGVRMKAKSKLKADIEVEAAALEQRATDIIREAVSDIGVDIVDPDTLQKVGFSDINEVVIEQIENYKESWLNKIEDPNERERARQVMERAIERARDILAARRKYTPPKGKKLTAKQKAEAEAAHLRRAEEARRRAAIREANEAVNPEGIGILMPPKKRRKTKAEREQEKVEAEAQAQEERLAGERSKLAEINKRRKRRGLKPVKSLEVTTSMTMADALDELVALDNDSEGKTTTDARLDITNRVRAAGIKISGPGGKKNLLELVRRRRNGQPLIDSEQEVSSTAGRVEVGAAQPITEEGRAKRAKADTVRKSWRVRGDLRSRARKREKSEDQTVVTHVETIQDAVDRSVKQLRAISEALLAHEKRILRRIRDLERGNITGRVQSGKRGRFRGGTQIWGSGETISIFPEAAEEGQTETQSDFPKLLAAIRNNMDPGMVPDMDRVAPPETLSGIDRVFGTNFVERLRGFSSQAQIDSLRKRRDELREEGKSTKKVDERIAELEAMQSASEIDQTPVALALAEDIRNLLNDAAMFGQNAQIERAVAVQTSTGDVIIRVTTGEVVGRAESGSVTDKVDALTQVESDIEFSERDRDRAILAEFERQEELARRVDLTVDDTAELDDGYVAWSKGEAGVVIKANEGGAEVVERLTAYHRFINMLARITGKVTDRNFSKWLRDTVKDVQNQYGGQQVSLDEAQGGIDKVISGSAGKKAGLKKGDLEAVTDDMANPAELAVVQRMRRRGRRVILYRANTPNGVAFNGFVSEDANTMYIRVGSLGPNVFSKIRDRRARKLVQREYERIMMQLIRHENFHLFERDPESATLFRSLADTALDIATGREYGDLFNNEEQAAEYAMEVLGMSESEAKKLAKTKAGRATIVSELRAEASSQIDALRESGAEGLYTDRNIIDATLDRIRRALTRLGLRGPAAYQALKMVEFETKVALAESARRSSESGGTRNLTKFSADYDIDGVSIVDASTAEVAFSRTHGGMFFGLVSRPWAESFREGWQDQHIRLRNVTKDLENAYGKLPDNINPLQLIDIAPGLVARRSQVFMNDEFNPVIDAMQEDGITMAEMGRYLHAQHAKEANAHLANKGTGKTDSGMTDAQADQIIDEVENGPKGAEFKKHAAKLQAMARESLALMREAGLITQADYDNIIDVYKFYVPLADPTHDKEYEDSGGEPVVGINQIGRAMYRRKGRSSDDNIIDNLSDNDQNIFFEGILLHIATQRARVIRRAVANDGLNRVLNLALTLPGNDKTFTVDPDTKYRNADGSVNLDKLRSSDSGKSALVVRVNRDVVIGGKPYLKGEQVIIRPKDQKLTLVLNGYNKDFGGALGPFLEQFAKAAGWYSNLKRSFATRYNLEFTIVNPIRDMLEAIASLKSIGFTRVRRRMLGHIIPAMTEAIRYAFSGQMNVRNPAYQEYLDSGGQQNFFRVQDAADIMRMIKKNMAARKRNERGIALRLGDKSTLGVIRAVGKFLDRATNSLDDSVRFAAWQIAKEEGYTTEQATALSRDITVDFSRRGATWGTYLNQIFAFSNVGTQGIEKLTRKSGRVLTHAAMYGFMNSLLCSLAFDDDEWDDIPDYIKANNFIIPLPWRDEEGKRDFQKIPLPYGLNIFVNLGQSFGESMFRGKPITSSVASGMAEGLLGLSPIGGQNILADSTTPSANRFGPLQRSSTLQMLLPDIADPLVTAVTGFDWTGKRAFPNDYGSRAMAESGFSSTGEHWKWISNTINQLSGGEEGIKRGSVDFSPEVYRFIAYESFFGPARLIDRTVAMFDKIGDPSMTWNDYPVVRRFFDEPRTGSKNRELFYEFENEVEIAKRTEKEWLAYEAQGLGDFMSFMRERGITKEEVNRRVQLIRAAEDPDIKFALNFRRKYNDAETKARADHDYDKLETIQKYRDKAYGIAAKRYKEILEQ